MSINDLPPGFKNLLKDFTIAVIRKKPPDVVKFAASYFKKLETHRSFTDPVVVAKEDVTEIENESSSLISEVSCEKVQIPRKTVAAERFDPEQEDEEFDVPFYQKSTEQLEMLKKKCQKILIFQSVDDDHMEKVLGAMFEKRVEPGDYIIKQGEEGDNFYVIAEGEYDVFIKEGEENRKILEYKGKGSFGELALMYDAPRAATVQATTSGYLWALDRATFRQIVLRGAYQKRQMFETMLESVSILKSLSAYERMVLGDALRSQTFEDGQCIIKQGAPGEIMYFIESGEVRCTMKETPESEEVEISRLGPCSYFGELALITRKPRAASAYAVGKVRCGTLDVQSFERLLGPCLTLMQRNIDDYKEQCKAIFD